MNDNVLYRSQPWWMLNAIHSANRDNHPMVPHEPTLPTAPIAVNCDYGKFRSGMACVRNARGTVQRTSNFTVRLADCPENLSFTT
jgi:hypothetical protein